MTVIEKSTPCNLKFFKVIHCEEVYIINLLVHTRELILPHNVVEQNFENVNMMQIIAN